MKKVMLLLMIVTSIQVLFAQNADITFEIKSDIAMDSDVAFRKNVGNDTKIPLREILFQTGRGIYIGGSNKNKNLPYKVSLFIDNQKLAETDVRGLPLPGQKWRECNNIDFSKKIEVSIPDLITCNIACDIPGKDKGVYNNISNKSVLDLKVLESLSGRNIYIGNVVFRINFKEGNTILGFIDVNTNKLPGQSWRESSNIVLNTPPSNENAKLTCEMPAGIKCDLEFDIKNGSDCKYLSKISNGAEISYKELIRRDTKKKNKIIKSEYYNGVYVGASEGSFDFNITFNSCKIADTRVYCKPLPNQTWRESENFNFKNVRVVVNDVAFNDIIKQYAPYVEFSKSETYFPSNINFIFNKVNLFKYTKNIKVKIENKKREAIDGKPIIIMKDVNGEDERLDTIENGCTIIKNSVAEKLWNPNIKKYLGGSECNEVVDVFFYDNKEQLCKIECANTPPTGQKFRTSDNFSFPYETELLTKILFDTLNNNQSKKFSYYGGWIPTSDFDKRGDLNSCKVYTVINTNNDEKLDFTFHFFYPYNGSNLTGLKSMQHYGDWERFAVHIDKKDKANCYFKYFFHKYNETISFEEAENKKNHPCLYVCAETHAGFWSKSKLKIILKLKDEIIKELEKTLGVGLESIGDGKNIYVSNCFELVTKTNGNTEANFNWIDWNGVWGHPAFHRGW